MSRTTANESTVEQPSTQKSLSLLALMREDARAALARDPAARSMKDIVLFSVGTHAVWAYRKNHWLYERGFKNLALWLAKRTRKKLGVDIHPAARIGRRFTIDHGMGVVVGSTAIIGDDCLVYQGATLGMTGKKLQGKRHPTLGNNVLVGAGAIILGDIEIHDGVKVGAGAVVLRNVPAHVTVAGVPASVVRNHAHATFTLVGDTSEPDVEAEYTEGQEWVRWSCAL